MLQLKTLYSLPVSSMPLTDDMLRGDWFCEVGDLRDNLDEDILDELRRENRLMMCDLLNNSSNGHCSLLMYSVWFDDEPVMVVQASGREDSNFSRRMITDPKRLEALSLYIRSKLDIEVASHDVVDPEAFFFEEELFKFVGSIDYGAQYGYPCQPRVEGYQLLPDAYRVLNAGPKDMHFVAAQAGLEMPQYMRRHLCVLEKVRAASDAELTTNPRVLPHYHQEGFTQFCWYRECPTPMNQPIVVF